MPGVKLVTDTQTDWQQGTLSGVVATAAGDVELAKEPLDHNILANGGFNADLSGWTLAGNPVIDSSVTVEGAASARMDGTGNTTTNVYIYADVPLQAGTTYIVSFWARTQGASKLSSEADAGPRFRWGVGGNPVLDAPVNYELPADSDWTFYSFIATATAAGAPRIEFSLHDVVAGGKMWVDDVQLRVFGHAASGSRTSPPIDLSPVGTAEGSSIAWNATTPSGTSVTVETNLSLDGGQTWEGWQQATNGGAIPGIMPGTDLSNARLQTRVTLSTTDTTATPQLHSLTVAVPVVGSTSAPVLVQIGVSRSIAPPVPVSVGLAKAVSGPVLVQAGLAKATARELRVYAVAVSRRVPASRHIRARLNIGRPDGATWQDVTDYLASARVSLGDVRALGTGNEGVDERVRMATFVLRQDRVPGGPSLSPRDRTSPWNQWDEKYFPLIWPRRQVLFDCCVQGLGDVSPNQHETRKWAERVGFGDGTTRAFQLDRWPVEPGSEVVYVNGEAKSRGTDYSIDYATGQVTFATPPPAGLPITADYTYWLPVFEGLIDDWRTDGPTVEFNCRDLAAVLQDAYIEMTRTYGSGEGTPLEQVIQQILDDNLGAGAVQLYCPRSPGFAVRPYNVEYQSVWDAVQSAVSKTIGWYLGYWLDPATNRFRLTLLEPPRNKTAADADWELDYRDDIYVDDLGGSIADVRNVVRVTFRNAATGKRETITVEDSASIAEYGRRAMQIEEADASLIDTPEEATALAVAAVSDLKDQHATANLELPFLPMLDVMDGVVVRDDRVSSEPNFYAVESVEHMLDFDGGRFRTTAVCSGRVVGAHTRWMEMQTRPGAQQPVRMISADAVEVTQSRPPKPRDVRAYGVTGGIVVTVPEPQLMKNWRFTRVRVYDDGGELVVEDAARATRFQFLGLAAGARYHAEAQYEDSEGTEGDWSDKASAVAGGEFTALTLVVQESAGVGTDLTVRRDATIAGKASVGVLESQGAVSGTVVRATQYIQLPVLSEDPSNPPNGAMWMRA